MGARHDRATRERLVSAATALFAARGFRGVTVRAIADRAGANLAAVNYYYGDKLGLYREVVRRAVAAVANRLDYEAPAGTSAEDRLRHYVRAYLPHLARPRGREVSFMNLMRNEMDEPTALAPWIAEQFIMPRIRYLGDVVGELLGCPADDVRVRRSIMSLQAQCLFYMPNRFRAAAIPGWRELTLRELDEEARHVAEFTLAGIHSLGRTARSAGPVP